MKLTKLNIPPCLLGEGALWHRETQEFVFTDIMNGDLFAADEDRKVRTLLHCRYQLGAFLFDQNGDLILFTPGKVFKCRYGYGEEDFRLICKVPMKPDERFNDACVDPKGRIFAGSKTERNVDGSLWLFERKYPPRRVMEGLKISNGMGFSPNRTIFYHTDSEDRTIYQYIYNCTEGCFFDKKIFVHFTSLDGSVPDGMKIDKDGNVWTACWGGGCIRCYSPNGNLLHTISLPSNQISSLAFGGSMLDHILVTSASCGSKGSQEGFTWLLSDDNIFHGKEDFRALI